MKIGIFYATNTGFTEDVADELRRQLGPSLIDTCVNIEDRKLEELQGYDVLLIGIATWDAGDLPYDWALFYDEIPGHDFKGTRIAMFGLGDQVGYPETFLDAMGIVYRGFLAQGATGDVGFWPTADYQFNDSKALYGDQFCGLALDEDNEPDLTAGRIAAWAAQVKRELNILTVCDGPASEGG